MSRRKPLRQARRRTRPTTNGQLPVPGHADPGRHITRAEGALEVNTNDARYAGTVGWAEWVDTDLDRRLQRRGWGSTGITPGSGWTYPSSLRVADTGPEPAIDPAVSAAIDEHMSAQADWMAKARALPDDLSDEEVIERIGRRPQKPPIVTEWMEAGPAYDNAGPTTILIGNDGASYDVSHPGFDDDVEYITYTDRHKLLGDLDQIETWRFIGPAWRWRASRGPN